ncbi:MAG: 2Fe-2S iron-sulfur cluster binding domain-containing protein [Planctomycetes bacterium]|nr:2Fe-2S iron-sulfur cluster binding domain-containing protein [Planctomycetota bacterium]
MTSDPALGAEPISGYFMTMHQVTFKGAERTVQAEDGETLLALAQRHDLHIDSSCGGNGSCHQCRVVIQQGEAMRQGQPAVARHRRGDEPVYLACQCEVRGDMVVEAAPTHALGVELPQASLLGWSVAGERPDGPELAVYDPGQDTAGAYYVDSEGNITREKAYAGLFTSSIDDAPLIPGHREIVIVGGHQRVSDAILEGVSHLGGDPLVLDLLGRCCRRERRFQFDISPMLKGLALHMPGAIHHVEWSPLKTRTVIATVQDKPPTGLSLSGLLSTAVSLVQAGMCSRGLLLTESRFTSHDEHGDLQVEIVGPDTEAQSLHGVVYRSPWPIRVTQYQLDMVRAAAREMHFAVQQVCAPGYRGPLVLTGDFGTYAPAELIWSLNIWGGEVQFVPHAAALGAARLAFRRP